MDPLDREDAGDAAVAFAWMVLALAFAIGAALGVCAGLFVASL